MQTKSILLTFFVFLALFSCSRDVSSEENNLINNESKYSAKADNVSSRQLSDFDYSFYNTYSNQIVNDLNTFKNSNPEPTEEGIQMSIDFANQNYDSSLTMLQYDQDLLNSEDEKWQDFYRSKNYLTENEIALIEKFSEDADSKGYEIALENFKTNIINLYPSDEEFKKYNHLVNTIMIANDYYETQPKNPLEKRPAWWAKAGCAASIISNAGATYALIACAVPNPTTPAACTVAVVFKVVSLAGVVFGCG